MSVNYDTGRYADDLREVGLIVDVEVETRSGQTHIIEMRRNQLERDQSLVDRARERAGVKPEDFARGDVL